MHLHNVGPAFGRQALHTEFPNGVTVSYNVGERHVKVWETATNGDLTNRIARALNLPYEYAIIPCRDFTTLGRILDRAETIIP